SGGEEKEKVYSAQETALFQDKRMVALLTEEETFAFSLLESNITAGTFTVQKDGKSTSMTVIEDDGSIELNMDGAPKATLSVEVRVRLYNRCAASPVEDLSTPIPTPEDLENAKNYLTAGLQSLMQKSVESGCDVFLLKRSLYRSSVKKYNEWEETLLTAVTPEFKVEVNGVA
ncbi:MAG: Ger(x)C family spore germination C-terminal domain-containing protein, partial [Clostridiales bacterium]|nr:Ger(x)C family spore germination C-terminal domain-containing protein [Clostridiales bacterium]